MPLRFVVQSLKVCRSLVARAITRLRTQAIITIRHQRSRHRRARELRHFVVGHGGLFSGEHRGMECTTNHDDFIGIVTIGNRLSNLAPHVRFTYEIVRASGWALVFERS